MAGNDAPIKACASFEIFKPNERQRVAVVAPSSKQFSGTV
ncbi:unnamed protein product [Onchocerca flexuosa]|uniref:MSP domain-containing protein n=1 Tax=Onchocerca flexuosa TaxID=387005 RepID=A0A183HL23_9BILA|nr:unnamed protein product [Onchocerca flexuosa]